MSQINDLLIYYSAGVLAEHKLKLHFPFIRRLCRLLLLHLRSLRDTTRLILDKAHKIIVESIPPSPILGHFRKRRGYNTQAASRILDYALRTLFLRLNLIDF
jgi:hypothetical protein